MSSMIDCLQLTKTYGSNTALNRVNFSVDNGDPIALVGPNGSGKTTLFSLMCGYIRPTSGIIQLFGHQPGSPALFGRVSALPQDAQLDPRFAIGHQLKFYAQLQGMSTKQAQLDCERVLDLVELKHSIKDKPNTLSHGMRKRITIAQALLGSPELVLLDEPTAGLDPVNARNIRQLIAQNNMKTTFMISSHNLNELEKLCGTVLHLNLGLMGKTEAISSDPQQGFITLHMESSSADLKVFLSDIPSIHKVSQLSRNEYLISYDPAESPDLDIKILKMLDENQLNYRQLIKGKSLEEQLFSSETPN